MSEAVESGEHRLAPAGERSLAHAPGGLAARGRTLAAELLAQTSAAAGPGGARCLTGHTDCVVGVAFSPDGRFGASASWDRTVRVWEMLSGREMRRIEGHSDRVSSVAFSPDGRWVLTGSWDGTARIWAWETGSEVARFGDEDDGMVHCVAFSPGGRHAAWGGSSGEFRVVDVLDGSESFRCEVPRGAVRCLQFSPDGHRLLSGSGQVAVAGRGKDNGTVCLWDAERGERLWGWSGATEPVLTGAFSSDMQLAFSATGWPARDRLNVTQVWDIENRALVYRCDTHRHPIFSAVFVPETRCVLMGGRDRQVRLVNPLQEGDIHVFSGHTDSVFSVAVSSDGCFALSGSADRTVRLWSLPEMASRT